MHVFTSDTTFENNVQSLFWVCWVLYIVVILKDPKFDLGSVYIPIITSLFSPIGIANEQKKLYGTQFHPEVDLTERGTEMLRNFLFEIAECTSTFTVQNRQQTCITEIQEKVGKSKVLVSKTAPDLMSVCVNIFFRADLLKRKEACFNLQLEIKPSCWVWTVLAAQKGVTAAVMWS